MNSSDKIELKRLLTAALMPAFFVALCWLMFAAENILDLSFSQYGLKPRCLSQWFGIFTMPFLHSGLSHIFANSVSFFVLGTMIFYFYPQHAIKILLVSYFLTGILSWLIAVSGIHIGASGMIYSFSAYIFIVGVLSRNVQNMALSLIVVFLYGSMIWGLFPNDMGISWEGHLSGALTGCLCAFLFPVRRQVEFEELDDSFDTTADEDLEIKYFYRESDENGSK
ncbi:MAG: rhomboid family intramembrane serine protease [Bacteroidales bacterium]|nr:rhomboid family intramembrane serine protease [Bacteroidales bacterium]